jgi:hypothetical protein
VQGKQYKEDFSVLFTKAYISRVHLIPSGWCQFYVGFSSKAFIKIKMLSKFWVGHII